jgi:putative acetyltransferase
METGAGNGLERGMVERAAPSRLEGGCLCGAIRYRIARVFDAGYCHCSRCRKGGAPVSAWARVEAPDFALMKGSPARYRSSDLGARCFCMVCGSAVFFEGDGGAYFSVAIGTLDDPEQVPPRVHLFGQQQLRGLELVDDLPRVAGNVLPHPDRRDAWQLARAVVVRSEAVADHAAIRRVHDAAFGRDAEGLLIDVLRRDGRFSPDMSVVGVTPDGEIVGHVLHSALDLEVDGVAVRAAALAPVAVVPAFQRAGIGTKLVREGLHRMRLLGYDAAIVVGHPAYYGRFGFSQALAAPIASPYAGEHHQALELTPGVLSGATRGRVTYPPAFAEVP